MRIITLPEEEQIYLLKIAKNEKLKKGDFFHREDKVCKKIGIVKQGLLKSYVINELGNEKIIEFFPEKAYVSAFTSFISGVITDWNIQAIEDTEIISISKDLLENLYQRNSCWLKFGLDIFETQTLKKCNREKTFLINTASERYLTFRKQYADIESRLSLLQIAQYLGIQPESLSRIRKELSLNIDQGT